MAERGGHLSFTIWTKVGLELAERQDGGLGGLDVESHMHWSPYTAPSHCLSVEGSPHHGWVVWPSCPHSSVAPPALSKVTKEGFGSESVSMHFQKPSICPYLSGNMGFYLSTLSMLATVQGAQDAEMSDTIPSSRWFWI